MIDVVVPQIGESITVVYINSWMKKPGEAIAEGESLLEVDSDKATLEVPSPVSGVLVECLVDVEDEVAIGAIVARIDETATAGDSAPEKSGSTAAAAPESSEDSEVRAGPAARREAGERGVDLNGVSGTAKHGRVTREDVERAASGSAPAAAKAPAAPAAPSAPADNSVRQERVPMTRLRRTIAKRLVEAQQEAAMLTTFNEVDMSAVMDLRKQWQDNFVKRHGHKIGFMSFFVKATIEALKEYPAVNAEIDGTDIVYKNYYNIGVAVSGPKGLMVPVLRDADRLSFSGVETGIMELANKARDNKITPDDFADGTFTISNGGIFGSMMSTPILNRPQVGILGMHNIVKRAVVVNDQIVIRPMMYLALSYDHRIIDGKEAVSFLVRIKECIENPERILLEV